MPAIWNSIDISAPTPLLEPIDPNGKKPQSPHPSAAGSGVFPTGYCVANSPSTLPTGKPPILAIINFTTRTRPEPGASAGSRSKLNAALLPSV